MTKEHFLIGVYWLNHKVTADQYMDSVYQYLMELQRFSKDFDHPKVVNEYAGIQELIFSYNEFKKSLLPLMQQNDNYYRDSAGNKSLHIQPHLFSDSGFYNEFIFDKESESIGLTITAGNYLENEETSIVNNVLIELPEHDPKYKNLNFIKELFQLTIQHWDPTVGWVISREFRRKVNNGANTLIGWINYFTNSKIEDFITDEIKKERFRNGIITTLSEKAPSCDNQLDVNKAISFRDVLSQNEILNWRN